VVAKPRKLRISVLTLTLLFAMAVFVPAAGAQQGRQTPGVAQDNLFLLDNSPRTAAVSQSDLAFWGDRAYVGYYQGFRILDISNPRKMEQLADVKCDNVQGDVSVWEDLLIVSIDSPVSAPDCSGVNIGSSHPAWPGWEGIRIFDVSDPATVGPDSLIAAVATDCGSHTHTLLPDLDNNRLLIYISVQRSNTGDSIYGTSCRRINPDTGEPNPGWISIVEVPLDAPEEASVIAKPEFEIDDFRGAPGARGCHDIGVFMEIGLAAAACHSEGQLWDISDPVNPTTIARFHFPEGEEPDNFIWHSGAFSHDGEIVIFGDEFAGGGGPGCNDPNDDLGRIYFYSVDTQELLGDYKVPRSQLPQTPGDSQRLCTMHNYNIIPTHLGYYLVSASNMAGTTVVDFNDPANAKEIAYFDANPPDAPNTLASPWSSYWYNGIIYANDRARGVDSLFLQHPARAAAKKLDFLNPQTQMEVIPLRGNRPF